MIAWVLVRLVERYGVVWCKIDDRGEKSNSNKRKNCKNVIAIGVWKCFKENWIVGTITIRKFSQSVSLYLIYLLFLFLSITLSVSLSFSLTLPSISFSLSFSVSLLYSPSLALSLYFTLSVSLSLSSSSLSVLISFCPAFPFYLQVTCATDTRNVRVVFDACKDIILRENLKNSGFMD